MNEVGSLEDSRDAMGFSAIVNRVTVASGRAVLSSYTVVTDKPNHAGREWRGRGIGYTTTMGPSSFFTCWRRTSTLPTWRRRRHRGQAAALAARGWCVQMTLEGYRPCSSIGSRDTLAAPATAGRNVLRRRLASVWLFSVP